MSGGFRNRAATLDQDHGIGDAGDRGGKICEGHGFWRERFMATEMKDEFRRFRFQLLPPAVGQMRGQGLKKMRELQAE